MNMIFQAAQNRKKSANRGAGLLEVLFGVSVVAIVLFALLGAYNTYLKSVFKITEKIQASFLAEEGVEALRIIRDGGWSGSFGAFTPGTPYYFSFDSGTWKSTTTEIVVDNFFYRNFIVSAVNRDANDDITSSGGTNDPNTKKVTVAVSFNSGSGTSTLSISTYMTNLFQN